MAHNNSRLQWRNLFTADQIATGTALGPTDGDIVIKSDGDITLHLDDDSDESSSFIIKNGGNTNIFTVDESGNTVVGGNLTVSGTTTTVNQTEVNVQNAFVFEGATANAHETTLAITEPTADATINLPAMAQGTYHLPVLEAASTVAITSTPAELNLLDDAAANTVVNSKAVIYGSSGELAGTLSTAAQPNVTSVGTLASRVHVKINNGQGDLSSIDGPTALLLQRTTALNDCQMSIISANNGKAVINLGRQNDENPGGIFYDNSNNSMAFRTNATSERVVINSDGTTVFNAPVSLKYGATAGGELKFYEDSDNGTNFVALKAPPAITADTTWWLPVADGTAGQQLTTDGNGNLSWTAQGASGGNGTMTSVKLNNNAVGGADIVTLDFSSNFTATESPDTEIQIGIAAAQTTITSIHATDLIVGEDADTAVDFGTPNEIQFKADGDAQVLLNNGEFKPVTDSDVDLGSSALRWKDAYVDSCSITGNAIVGNTIELGHATDTTISRTGAGAIAVEGTAVLLAGAQTLITTDYNAGRKVGRDADNLIDFATTDDKIIFRVEGVNEVELVQNALSPVSNDGVALGTTALGWSDLFLADAGTVTFGNDQDIVLTHVADKGLTLSSAASGMPEFTLKNTNNDAAGGRVVFHKDGANAADNDILGVIDAEGENDAGTPEKIIYGHIEFSSPDISDSSEDGAIELTTMVGGSATALLDLNKTLAGGVTVLTDLQVGDDVSLKSDGAILKMGANEEIAITHVHDTGILVTDSGGTPTIQLHDANESISSDGSNLILTSGGTAYKVPTSDGSNGHVLKTDGNGTLSFGAVSGGGNTAADDIGAGDAAINLTTTTGNITIDAQGNDTDIIFKGTDGNADTTFLTLNGADAGRAVFNNDVRVGVDCEVLGDLIVGAGADEFSISESSDDITISTLVSNKDMIFKVNDGGSATEVFRLDGDVSALLVASGKELRFADSGEKISGDGTDLTIASGAKINLNATSDVHIPNNVGIVFGGDSEKIEGDGTDLTISANNLTIDCAADLILDAGGDDFKFKVGGTEILNISNSSSDVVIKPIVDAKDLIFQQRDGTEVARIEDNGTFNVVTDKLAINGTAITATAAELNLIDGGTARGTDAVATGDGILINDNGTMKMTNVDTVSTYFASHSVGGSNMVTVGALDAGSITSGFGAIDNGTSGIRTDTFTAETSFVPSAQDGASLGTSSLQFSDLFLADSAVVSFGDDNEITLTHSHNDGLILESANAGKPVFTVKTTHTTKGTSGELQFLKDAADTEDGEVLGKITFFGEDEGNNNTQFAGIIASISESDETDEAGVLELQVAESDGTNTAMTTGLKLEGEHATDGQIDVTIAAGAASTTTIAGTLTMGSTAAMTNAGLLSVANQSNITGVGDLASGTIAAGFGAIDNGTSGIRTNTFTAETSVVPDAADGATLGTASLEWSDLYLADGAEILFGNDQEIRLTHVADQGLTLKHTATADDKPVTLTLATGETDIAVDDIIGKILFQAPDEGTGTDAILACAGIQAVSEGDFAANSNATSLHFMTGASEAATAKLKLTSAGVLNFDATVNGIIGVQATAHDVAGKNMTVQAGATTTGSGDNNIAGGSLTLSSGIGKGSAAAGGVVIQDYISGASGNSAQTSSLIAKFTTAGNELHHSSTYATNTLAMPLANDAMYGEYIYFNPGNQSNLTAGKLYYMHTDGNWTLAQSNANSTAGKTQLLAIAAGTTPSTHGMLIRGFFHNHSYLDGTADEGIPVYVSDGTAGSMDCAAPSASNMYVRVLGHCMDNGGILYFNPSSTSIKIA